MPLKSKGRQDHDRRGAGQGFERPDTGPRVLISRARDDEGEWIRAEGPDRSARDDGGRKRGFGDRPPRGEGAPGAIVHSGARVLRAATGLLVPMVRDRIARLATSRAATVHSATNRVVNAPSATSLAGRSLSVTNPAATNRM